MNRRSYLLLSGGALTAVAGCTGDGDGNGERTPYADSSNSYESDGGDVVTHTRFRAPERLVVTTATENQRTQIRSLTTLPGQQLSNMITMGMTRFRFGLSTRIKTVFRLATVQSVRLRAGQSTHLMNKRLVCLLTLTVTGRFRLQNSQCTTPVSRCQSLLRVFL